MDFLKNRKNRLIIFFIVSFLVLAMSYGAAVLALPSEVVLIEGEEYSYNFKSPLLVNISSDKDGILKLNNGDITANRGFYKLSDPLVFKSQKYGSVNLNFKAFGLIPLRTIHVDIVPNKKVVACGSTIGVKIKIDGVLVVGYSNVESVDGRSVLPVKDTGIRPGDLITKINDKEVYSIDELVREIEKSGGNPIKIRYKRENEYRDISVKPERSMDDKKYHIGLWVRDSSAGIGTLTFYDPQTNYFGALGHGITDIDTATLMPSNKGEIVECKILSIKKGRQGSPGELKGVFVEDKNSLGEIKSNCSNGIYGIINRDSLTALPTRTYSIGTKSQIKEGAATILANIDGNKVEEFTIEVQKVLNQNTNSSKGMTIKITDKRLLDTTGGIVQGMSGSPIIQNDRIIGAVTHVLVNDPTRGYGICIEQMIKSMNSLITNPLQKAG
ncbi:MAG: SpoIVB peptidase [Clostridiales bacterium]|nr:SpoIVB peptidase [Eubacteriales bacterium]MDH7565220.1 SpoIVB peptidase [Clostridiales bacterium]